MEYDPDEVDAGGLARYLDARDWKDEATLQGLCEGFRDRSRDRPTVSVVARARPRNAEEAEAWGAAIRKEADHGNVEMRR